MQFALDLRGRRASARGFAMPKGEPAETAALQVVTVDWEPVDREKALFGRAK